MSAERTRPRLAAALLWTAALLATCLAWTGTAQAHPEDEFCMPGSYMDPVLCEQLEAMDRGGPVRPLPGEIEAQLDRPFAVVMASGIGRGVAHILPGGLDHILFVLALLLAARSAGSLAAQISVFTLAHSASLAFVAAGGVPVDPRLAETGIALTLVVAGAEAARGPREGGSFWPKLALVFVFGLIHGMGFGNFFLGQAYSGEALWASLIGFNIGVEIGQLAVVLAAALPFLLLLRSGQGRWVRRLSGLAIAATGLWWAAERALG